MKIKYLTDMKCTYLLHENTLQEDLYRIQLLQIFNLKKWDDNIINSTTKNLFNCINDIFKYHSESLVLHDCHINNILNKLKISDKLQNILMFCDNNDNLIYFKLLFSFEYFQYSHSYFCELLNNFNYDNNCFSNNSCLLNKSCLEDNLCNEDYFEQNKALINAYNIIYNNL